MAALISKSRGNDFTMIYKTVIKKKLIQIKISRKKYNDYFVWLSKTTTFLYSAYQNYTTPTFWQFFSFYLIFI